MPDRAVPQIEEVGGRLPGALGLIGFDDGISVAGVGVHHDDVHVRREGDGGPIEEMDLDEDDDPFDESDSTEFWFLINLTDAPVQADGLAGEILVPERAQRGETSLTVPARGVVVIRRPPAS